MKKYTIKRYENTDYDKWNAFVDQAKNGTFLFHRDFMEYHKERFQDYSLIVLDNEKWAAVLPANKVENNIYSHQGLSYGGLIYSEKEKLTYLLEIFKTVLFFLNENGIGKAQIKTMPSIYHDKPADELQYILFLVNATLIRRDSLAVINLSKTQTVSNIRKRGRSLGIKNNLTIKEVEVFDEFWNEILIPNLAHKYNLKPVHTVSEISKLKGFFPKKIRQFNVYHNDKIVAGTTVFESKNVAHCQYISVKSNEKEIGALDFLYHHLINEVFKYKLFFDFGNSNENSGRNLNAGLSYWKESFGASIIAHDYYDVNTANFSLLENTLI